MTTLKRCALMLCILFGLLSLVSLGCKTGREENVSTVRNFTSYEELGNYIGRLVKGRGFSLGFGCTNGHGDYGPESGDSQTNVQTEGVDESDLVKVDDGFIFTVSYGDSADIAVINARDNKTLFIPCDYTPVEFYVAGEVLVVFGTYYLGGEDDSWSTSLPAGDLSYADLWDRNNVRVSAYDISALTPQADLSRLTAADLPMIRTVMVPNAEFISTRRVDSQVFLALRSVNLFNYYGQTYVPKIYDDAGNFEGSLELEDIFLAPHDGKNLQFVYLLSFDLEQNTPVQARAYFTSADMVYMSRDNLYLAFSKYSTRLPAEQRRTQTTVLRFVREGGMLTYSNYVLTDGFLTSPLAMYERDGALFLCLTTGRNQDGVTANSHTYIYAYDLNGEETRLQQCGQESEGVGAGCGVAGVSFSENSCYVTTQRESMVYLFDISDPAAPHLISQKKTMGVNDYLFDLTGDGTVMLGIGQNKIGNTLRGIRFSVYRRTESEEGDVLTEVARYLNNDVERSVDLGQDYKAFLAWNDRYVFPFRSGRFFFLDDDGLPYEKYLSGAVLLDLTGLDPAELPLTSDEMIVWRDSADALEGEPAPVHLLPYTELPGNRYATLDVVKRAVVADGKLYLIGNAKALNIDLETREILAEIPLSRN